jgi:beta-lactamase regulating signal transducer with metallopeptidase domain/5-hydroxyisourate hydrolase-like protein (transthyretin family)
LLAEEALMSAAPLSFLETVSVWLAHASWQAAVLGLLVFLVSRALRGRLEARWRFCLWLVVLARLALPVTPSAPWSLFRLVHWSFAPPATNSPIEYPVATPLPTSHAWVTDTPDVGDSSVAIGVVATEGPPSLATAIEGSREESFALVPTTGQWLAMAWLAGVIVLLTRHGWLHMQLGRQRRTWREVSDLVACDVFRRCRQELGMGRSVRLWMTTGRYGPATSGVFRASILVPEGLLASLPPDELRLVLLHELTHVRRWDVLFDRVAAMLVAVHWFNPVAWLALFCMRRERELACDAAVLRHLGGREACRYGHTLLRVAQQLSAQAPLPGAVGVLGKDRSLVRRIHMIATYRKPTAAGKVLGALLLLALAALGLTDAAAQAPVKTVTNQAPASVKEPEGKPLTIAAVCQDEDGKPLAGVQVTLYRRDPQKLTMERLRSEATGDDGRIQFADLASPPTEADGSGWSYILAVAKPGKGSIIQYPTAASLKNPLVFKLPSAATLQGRVTDASGKPVVGARVWAGCPYNEPVDGVCSTRTDADGRYAITDMAPDEFKPERSADGKTFTYTMGYYFEVVHPNYAHIRPMYHHVPDTVDVVLPLEGIIDGKVVDQISGKPAADVLVYIHGTHSVEGGGYQKTRTDLNGKYRLSSLLAGKYNLWAEAPDRACTALDSFAVESGKTQTAPDLSLIEGGWIEGRLVDAATGKPISGAVKDCYLCCTVGLHGPSRPKSGGGVQWCQVDEQGRFRLHVAPGTNFPFIQTDAWERTQHRDFFQKGIEVKSGEIVSIVFRILPTAPIPDSDPAPVRLMTPVPAERQAAALVRQLGGWYEVNSDNHVVEVNMVYHQTPGGQRGQRYDNDRTDTDEALRAVSAFPRLKRLFLRGGQATDDGLLRLTKLSDLETFMVWDALKITDAGVEHLSGLTTLERLYLQGASLTDKGVAALKNMKEMRNLDMNGPAITDASVEYLLGMTKLQHLMVSNTGLTEKGVDRLLTLPELKSFFFPSAAISPEHRDEIQKRRPGVQVIFTVP